MDLNKASNLMLKCVPNATFGMHQSSSHFHLKEPTVHVECCFSRIIQVNHAPGFYPFFSLTNQGSIFCTLRILLFAGKHHASLTHFSRRPGCWLVSSLSQLGQVVTAQKSPSLEKDTFVLYYSFPLWLCSLVLDLTLKLPWDTRIGKKWLLKGRAGGSWDSTIG
jgi:hypothetical protein